MQGAFSASCTPHHGGVLHQRDEKDTTSLYLPVAAFITAIIAGTALLHNFSVSTLSWIDALFTATSAVCVTGLSVVDPASAFTSEGQTAVLILGGALALFFSHILSSRRAIKHITTYITFSISIRTHSGIQYGRDVGNDEPLFTVYDFFNGHRRCTRLLCRRD